LAEDETLSATTVAEVNVDAVRNSIEHAVVAGKYLRLW
jgi:hypothetical protein